MRRNYVSGMSRREALQGMVAAAPGMGMALAGRETVMSGYVPPVRPGKPAISNDVAYWVTNSLERVFPNSPVGSAEPLHLVALRGGRIAFQIVCRSKRTSMIRARAEVLGAEGMAMAIRRVGYVPLAGLSTDVPLGEVDGVGHLPGLAPDPLFPEATGQAGPEANLAFWVSLTVPPDARPGMYALTARMTIEDEFRFPAWTGVKPWSVDLPVRVEVVPFTLAPRRDFPVTHWVSADSIWEWYGIEPCGDRFWALAEAYLANLVTHNVNVAYVPMINNRHELLKRPAQLLRVRRGEDGYEFDFSDVRRWTRLAIKGGAEYVEWPHFFTPAPTSGKHPQRIYERWDGFGPLLWPADLPADSDTYRGFLGQFMPVFEHFLREEGLFSKSLFHCADEPDGDVQIQDYRIARGILREFAPWMEVIDAMSDTRFATEKLTDMPVPSIVTAPEFAKAGCPAWVYFCCGPRGGYLQRLHDTPLPKLRMAGWLFYRLGARGFLHWGHNYWFRFCTAEIIDPYQHGDVGAWPGMPYGDAFVVYPGADGPVDSIRWEVLADSLQDYAMLQAADVDPQGPLLSALIDYQDFPKSEAWIQQTLAKVVALRAGTT